MMRSPQELTSLDLQMVNENGFIDLNSFLSADELNKVLLDAENVQTQIKRIRVRVAKQLTFSGPRYEIAIKEAIRGKIICASKLKPILAAAYPKLSQAAKLPSTGDIDPLQISIKLMNLTNYIPDHLTHAILMLQILKPEYLAFKNKSFDYMNDADLVKVISLLSEEDANFLLKLIKTTRELILNFSAGYFQLETTIEETRIQAGYTPQRLVRINREVITEFMEAVEKDSEFLVCKNFNLTSTVKIDHAATRKILTDDTFDYNNPSVFYHQALGDNATDSLNQLLGIESAEDLQDQIAKKTAVIRHLKLETAAKDKEIIRLTKLNLQKKRQAEQKANLEKSREAKKSFAHRPLTTIYRNGTLAELRLRKAMLTSEDLFSAVLAENKKLVNELQKLKRININEFYVIRDNKPVEAKEDEQDAQCAIELAVSRHSLDLVRLLSTHIHVKISEKFAAYVANSANIPEKIKAIIASCYNKQKLTLQSNSKCTSIATPAAASPTVLTAQTIAIADDQLKLAKQYFELFNQREQIDEINDLICAIESSLSLLKQKATVDSDLEAFFMSANFRFNNFKEKFAKLVEDESIIVTEFKKHSLPESRKQHLKVVKNISAVKLDLTEINQNIATKIHSISAEREYPAEVIAPNRPASPAKITTTLFSPSTAEREEYQTAINTLLADIFLFTEFNFDKSLSAAIALTTLNLQMHALLFKTMELMEIRKSAHPQLAKDPIGNFSARILNALLHCKGLIDESPSPDSLQSFSIEVVNFSRKLIHAVRKNEYNHLIDDSFCKRVLAHAAKLEKDGEDNTEADSLSYTFSTCGQNLAFTTYEHALPANMQLSALSMVNSKAIIYDGYESAPMYLETICAAPLHQQRRPAS